MRPRWPSIRGFRQVPEPAAGQAVDLPDIQGSTVGQVVVDAFAIPIGGDRVEVFGEESHIGAQYPGRGAGTLLLFLLALLLVQSVSVAVEVQEAQEHLVQSIRSGELPVDAISPGEAVILDEAALGEQKVYRHLGIQTSDPGPVQV